MNFAGERVSGSLVSHLALGWSRLSCACAGLLPLGLISNDFGSHLRFPHRREERGVVKAIVAFPVLAERDLLFLVQGCVRLLLRPFWLP